MNLDKTRKSIDLIDFRIIRLLNERMELALRAGKLKQIVIDPEREKRVLKKVENHCKESIVRGDFCKELFNSIMKESVYLQELNLKLVGFQGEHGAYGEVAVRSFQEDLIPIPCLEFIDVFEGVSKGQLDIGIVPVENSLEGAVTQVNDLLVESDIEIIGEIKIPINHCLLALPDTDYREIKMIYSHPQALAQCRGFIQRNNLEPRPFYDTAGAAKMLAKDTPKAAAVIASKLCAELYNLEIIKENIEDEVSNTTRFIVISQENNIKDGNKSSIIFATEHKAGMLFKVLKLFADAGINLTRVESRPFRKDPGNYIFLLDFQGSGHDEKIKKLLGEVKKITKLYKYLGTYQEAKK